MTLARRAPQHDRQKFMCQSQVIGVDSVPGHQKPAATPLLKAMESVAGY